MGTFTADTPARLVLSATEQAARANVIAATGSPSPSRFTPIADPPAIYTHIGRDAQYGAGRRNGRTIRLLIMHTTEGDGFAGAMSYAARRAELVSASAYAGADGELGYGVAEADRPYTTGRWNDESLALEILGHAAWTDAQWRARPRPLEGITRILVDWCIRHAIPAQWLPAAYVAAGASPQSSTPRQGVTRGITDHLEANLAARLLGASTASTTHSDVGPALRRILITELIPEAARRVAAIQRDASTTPPATIPVIPSAPATPPRHTEEPDMPQLSRKNGKAAVWLGDRRFRTHVNREADLPALVAEYGPVVLLHDTADLAATVGRIVVGNDPGDV